MTPAAAPTRPTQPSARLGALDALRGIALLGIIVANVRQMFLPWEMANLPVPVSGGSRAVWWEWALFDALIDLKFLTVFSLLFGVGFELLRERLTASHRSFTAVYGRRLLFLALLGLAHGVLLYPAEVLLPYAVGGLLLLACGHLSARVLLSAGLTLLGVAVLLACQFAEFGRPDATRTLGALVGLAVIMPGAVARGSRTAVVGWVLVVSLAAVAIQAAAPVESLTRDREEFLAGVDIAKRMADSAAEGWPDDVRVHRLGNVAALVQLNVRLYADILLSFAVVLLWRTLGLFMVGAALVRLGAFLPSQLPGWRSVMMWGLCLGLPASALATALKAGRLVGATDAPLTGLLHHLSALVLAAGLVGAVVVGYERTRGHVAWRPFTAAGRMPLTNYVAQSVLLTTTAEGWGLGWYGYLDAPVSSGLAVVAFAGLAMLSVVWLRRYQQGPLEWVWRCVTYGRLLPNRAQSVPA